MIEIEDGKTVLEIDETKLREVKVLAKGEMHLFFVDGDIIVGKNAGVAILESFLVYLRSI